MRTITARSLTTAVVMLAIAGSANAQVTPSFVPLGDLPGGNFYSEALGVTPGGLNVVGLTSSHVGAPGEIEAFRWTAEGGMAGLGYPVPGYSLATGISSDGTVVVGFQSRGNGWEAFRWTTNGGRVPLSGIPSGYSSFAEAVSADGNVIAGYLYDGFEFLAFRWTAPTGPVLLLPRYGGSSVATAMSADGRIIVGYTLDGMLFRWSMDTGALTLGEPPHGFVVDVTAALSADGSTIVGTLLNTADYSQCRAYRWTSAQGFTLLREQTAAGRRCDRAHAVSSNGALVAGTSVLSDATGTVLEAKSFIWTERKGVKAFQDVLGANDGINLVGWTLGVNAIASDANANSIAIVGTGLDPAGSYEGWLAVLPAVQHVSIDIRPDRAGNQINVKSQGKVAVAILSTSQFDAVARMDRGSLRFGRTGNENSLASCDETPTDVNGDALADLVCRFEIPRTAFTCSDIQGVLTGETKDGNPLEGVVGVDSIQVEGCKVS